MRLLIVFLQSIFNTEVGAVIVLTVPLAVYYYIFPDSWRRAMPVSIYFLGVLGIILTVFVCAHTIGR